MRVKKPVVVWRQCDQCRFVALVKRSGLSTSRACTACKNGKLVLPTGCPYPELAELTARYVEGIE